MVKETRKNQYEKEKNQLKQRRKRVLHNHFDEIEIIEQWIPGFELKEVIFDSEVCEWEVEKSTFDLHVLNRNNLVFLIETEEGIKCGGVLFNYINGYQKFNYDENKLEGIVDENAFLFSFKDNKPMKYEIKQKMKHQPVFFLQNEGDETLFSLGQNDIIVGKKNESTICYQDEESQFDYHNNWKALVGKTGDEKRNEIAIKRVVVFQIKEDENRIRMDGLTFKDGFT